MWDVILEIYICEPLGAISGLRSPGGCFTHAGREICSVVTSSTLRGCNYWFAPRTSDLDNCCWELSGRARRSCGNAHNKSFRQRSWWKRTQVVKVWDLFHFRKNFLEIRLFYEEMNIETIEQKAAYGPGDLLGKRDRNSYSLLNNWFLLFIPNLGVNADSGCWSWGA